MPVPPVTGVVAGAAEAGGTTAVGDPPLPAAVLWDFDGTLVASEDYWIAEECALVESFGGTWDLTRAHALVGNELLTSGRYIAEHGPVPLSAAEIVDRLMAGVVRRLEAAVPWRPGVARLLAEVAAAGTPQALVTMSYRSVVRPVLDAMAAAGLPAFSELVTGEDVQHGKPHPEAYLRAMTALEVLPSSCVAIEDSKTGARSAAAAGAAVVVTPNAGDVAAEPGWWVLPDLSAVTLADLSRHRAGDRPR